MRLTRFWLAAGLFHAVLIGLVVHIGRRWTRRVGQPQTTLAWSGAVAGDTLLFAVVAVGWAAVCGSFGPGTRFLFLRLLAQAVFGEGIILAAWAALLHARRRLPLRASVLTFLTLGLLAAYAEAYHRGPPCTRGAQP